MKRAPVFISSRELIEETKRLDHYRQWLYDQVNREVERWWVEQIHNPYERFYLYYKQGDIRIAMDSPGLEYRLAMNERISGALTKEQIKYKAVEALRKCPCLPERI